MANSTVLGTGGHVPFVILGFRFYPLFLLVSLIRLVFYHGHAVVVAAVVNVDRLITVVAGILRGCSSSMTIPRRFRRRGNLGPMAVTKVLPHLGGCHTAAIVMLVLFLRGQVQRLLFGGGTLAKERIPAPLVRGRLPNVPIVPQTDRPLFGDNRIGFFQQTVERVQDLSTGFPEPAFVLDGPRDQQSTDLMVLNNGRHALHTALGERHPLFGLFATAAAIAADVVRGPLEAQGLEGANGLSRGGMRCHGHTDAVSSNVHGQDGTGLFPIQFAGHSGRSGQKVH